MCQVPVTIWSFRASFVDVRAVAIDTSWSVDRLGPPEATFPPMQTECV